MKTTARIFVPLSALLILVAASAPAQADAVSTAFSRSYKLEAKRKYSRALAALSRVSRSQEHSYIFQLRVGWLNYLAGKHRLAVEAYRKAARLAPMAVEPLAGMLLPQMIARRWKDALATANKILGMAPGNDLASTRKAWILFNLGRYRQAEQAYLQVLHQYPANLTLRAGLGWARAHQGRLKEAEKAFRAVLRYSPKNASASRGLAWVQKKKR